MMLNIYVHCQVFAENGYPSSIDFQINFFTSESLSSTQASTSGDKTVKLWRLHTSPTPKRLGEDSLFKTLQGHNNTVIGVAISPNGEFIASVSEDRTAKLWSRDGKLLHTFRGHDSGIWSVA